MKKNDRWLLCSKCGKSDRTDKSVIPHHIGTRESMKCPDCTRNEKGYATLCRSCCPTEHGTKCGFCQGPCTGNHYISPSTIGY